MLQFLKYLLATVTGIFVFLIISFLLLLGITAAFSDKGETKIAENSILNLDLNATITENAIKEDPFSELMSQGVKKLGLVDIKSILANAKLDPKIKGISIKLENPYLGMAVAEEIRNSLIDFKKSGKFVYTYAETMNEKAVYIASIADKSFINPAGGIEFNGLSAEVPFMKGLFEKIGVKPEIFRVGQYKSAVEPLFKTEMSPENKLQTTEYLNSIAAHMYGNIAKARGISMSQIENILNGNLIQTPEDAVKFKILTNVGYSDQYEAELKNKLALKADEEIEYVKFGSYKNAKKLIKEGPRDSRIAVLVSEGEIQSGDEKEGVITSDDFIKELRKAKNDKKIKAIVLRINSPGGSAMASDIMWREIQLAKKVKPVIASMGDVAASGGYYMAMGCDTIVAQPTTITGSIGIFGVIFNMKSLLNNKLGVTFDGVKTNTFADSPSAVRDMTDAEKMMIQNSINLGYEKFTSKAAAGRHMTIDKLKEVASGRVWTGEQAKKVGLVDILGGIDEAISVAAKKAKLSEFQVKYYPAPKSSFEQIIEKINSNQEEAKLKEYLGVMAPYAQDFQSLIHLEKVQARLPYSINIH